MKKIVSAVLNIVPLLAPLPTGWAVYAGLVVRSVWPMPMWIAIPGAVALVAVNVSVSSYIIDVLAFNKSLRRRDKSGDDGIQKITTAPGWALLILALVAEITLSLLVGIFPVARIYSILAFPMLAGAGVFTTILRLQLSDRAERLTARRAQPKTTTPQSETVAKTKRGKAAVAKVPCPHCKEPMSQNGLNAHVAYCKRNPNRRAKFSVLVSESVIK